MGTKAFSFTYAYWFLWFIYLKSKTLQVEWPELVNKYPPSLIYISQVIVCEVYW